MELLHIYKQVGGRYSLRNHPEEQKDCHNQIQHAVYKLPFTLRGLCQSHKSQEPEQGAVGANAPTQNIVWGQSYALLPHFTKQLLQIYKILLHSYYLRFVTSYLQLSPISVETMLHDYVVTMHIYLVTKCIKQNTLSHDFV